MASSEFIQRAYIAFFNRPADAEGFYYWLGYSGHDQDLLDLFAQSDEYRSDFANKSNREIIAIVYQNLFGRAPETEGWNYWEAQMNAGWVTIGNAAYEILGGAQGTDLTTIQNKAEAAQAFTNTLETPDEINAYARAGDNGLGHLAKEWLAAVSYTSQSLDAAMYNGYSVLTALIEANINTPVTPQPPGEVRIEGNTIFIESGYDYTIEFTPNRTYDEMAILKWDGGLGNGIVTVYNIDRYDTLDFSAYGVVPIGVAKLVVPVNGDGSYSPTGNASVFETVYGWPVGDFKNHITMEDGEKYITITQKPDATIFQIELWTKLGSYPEAYANYRNYDWAKFGTTLEYETWDTAQLIGFIEFVGFDVADLVSSFPTLSVQ